MNRAEVVFLGIDWLFHIPQNYINKDGVKCVKDVSYNDNYEECKVDLYYKETTEKMPVVVNIHGGGFVKGDKKHRKSISHLYADRGWFVVNANYRLAPKYHVMDIINDLMTLTNYLNTLAENYNIDLNKVVLTGDSAGAWAATYLTCLLTNPELRARLNIAEPNIKPAGLISFCGIYDLLEAIQHKIPFDLVKVIAESTLDFKFADDFSNLNDYPYAEEIAPINWLNKDFPRTIITYAKQDFFVKGQGERIYEKLKELGVDVEECHSEKIFDNHCYHFNFWLDVSKKTMDRAYKMLDEIYVQ